MPSSAVALKVVSPAGNVKRPVQRTEKLSVGRPAGPPPPQLLLMAGSHAVRTAVPLSAILAKYSAKNCPVGQEPTDEVTVKVWALEKTPFGFCTVTETEAGVATSAAVILAVTRVALTKLVGRAEPFQKSVVPDTKLLPSAVSVNAAPPAVAVAGVSVASVGPVGAALFQLTWATARPPRS